VCGHDLGELLGQPTQLRPDRAGQLPDVDTLGYRRLVALALQARTRRLGPPAVLAARGSAVLAGTAPAAVGSATAAVAAPRSSAVEIPGTGRSPVAAGPVGTTLARATGVSPAVAACVLVTVASGVGGPGGGTAVATLTR